jgi:hypothetical protein
MPPPVPVTQEPCRGEHRQADPDNEDQMGEINVIFRGSLNVRSAWLNALSLEEK